MMFLDLNGAFRVAIIYLEDTFDESFCHGQLGLFRGRDKHHASCQVTFYGVCIFIHLISNRRLNRLFAEKWHRGNLSLFRVVFLD